MRSTRRAVRRSGVSLLALAVTAPLTLTFTSPVFAHEKFDHPAFGTTSDAPLSSAVNSGGPGADWELVTTIPTGNPQTDIEFFTQGGEKYASLGTLGVGPNAGGQSIVQLTQDGEVDPSFVTGHPSAACLSNPEAALGLQHDVEATPKGDVISNSSYEAPIQADAQLIIDATDAEGRCHDQGAGGIDDGEGVNDVPQGGLELIDITDIESPVEIGLTSHIGQSHTVNVDPKRPHIAYSVTSDTVSVSQDVDDVDGDGDTEELIRENEDPDDSDRFDLDGFEVVDMSSCMTGEFGTLPEGATVEEKRESCRPEVFRYRYPTLDMSLGFATGDALEVDPLTDEQIAVGINGCHELEIYPNDRLTCGSGAAALVFDMSGAFDENDKPVGEPLACRPRASSTTTPGFATGATVTDCVVGGTDEEPVDLTIPSWIEDGSPSLEGVEWLGSVYHQGRGAGEFGPDEDIDFNHETEFTQSGDFLLATDERGGGVVPPGAACDQADANQEGNGGISAYQVDELKTERPDGETLEERADEAFEAYASGTDGEKSIFRTPIRTQPQPTFCTAHVMQQVPDQNRIFMGWYTQGTQVIDYVELPGGKLEFVEDAEAQEESEGTEEDPAVTAQPATEQAGFFIPEGANEWVSHVFSAEENEDGTFTYFGATGDFGRNAVDIYKVTLPAPATACTLAPDSTVTDRDEAREVHRDAVDCALHYDISNGKTLNEDGEPETYVPLEEVSREQMAGFIVNAIEAAGAGDKLPAPGQADQFTDLDNDLQRDSINRLALAGVVEGTGGGLFDPKSAIDRDQMASFIVRAARFANGTELEPTRRDFFGDVPPGDVHERNISAGFEAGFFQGTTAPVEDTPRSGTFSPDVNVPRDQMASFLVELFTQSIQQ